MGRYMALVYILVRWVWYTKVDTIICYVVITLQHNYSTGSIMPRTFCLCTHHKNEEWKRVLPMRSCPVSIPIEQYQTATAPSLVLLQQQLHTSESYLSGERSSLIL